MDGRDDFPDRRPNEGDDRPKPYVPDWDVADSDLTGDGPIDIAAIRADDEFIEALAADMPVGTRDEAEYRLAELLSGWRHEAQADPPPALPDITEVERAIAGEQAAMSRSGRAMRHLRLVSGAAAVVVVAAAGLIVVSEGAQPGDTLWGVKQVVFADQATQTQAMVDVQTNLERAEAAVASGEVEAAVGLISQAEQDLEPVRDEETRRRMSDWINRLRTDTEQPAPTAPAEPETTESDTDEQATAPGESGPETPPQHVLSQTPSPSPDTSVTVTVPPESSPSESTPPPTNQTSVPSLPDTSMTVMTPPAG